MISDNVVRLRGIPYDATKVDVANFFGDDFDIVEDGILLPRAGDGRASGQAYVQFTNSEDATKALRKNREHMGHRYVEVFGSTMEEAFRNQHQIDGEGSGSGSGGRDGPGPYNQDSSYGRGFGPNGPPGRGNAKSFGGDFRMPMGGNGMGMGGMGMNAMGMDMGMSCDMGTGALIRMEGIPFSASERDIADWFSSAATPSNIKINYNNDGRPAGNARVLFPNAQEAQKAMTKHKENMQHRYIELYYEGEVMGSNESTNMGPVMGFGGQSPLGMGNVGAAMGYGQGFDMGASPNSGMSNMGFGRGTGGW